jgi:ATP-dependent DNA helicase RecG
VVVEAIVNAIAHRDYASGAAVQVSVFADRIEVSNPGELPAPLTPERLRHPHSSIARNHRICEALFLTRYIEKFGTGTLMMIRESAAHGLPEPQFEQRPGEFVIKIWRDWLTETVLAELQLNQRQRQAISYLKTHGRIGNSEYQRLVVTAKRTAHRDLTEMIEKRVLVRTGTRGKGTFYTLRQLGHNWANWATAANPTQTRQTRHGQGVCKGLTNGSTLSTRQTGH